MSPKSRPYQNDKLNLMLRQNLGVIEEQEEEIKGGEEFFSEL